MLREFVHRSFRENDQVGCAILLSTKEAAWRLIVQQPGSRSGMMEVTPLADGNLEIVEGGGKSRIRTRAFAVRSSWSISLVAGVSTASMRRHSWPRYIRNIGTRPRDCRAVVWGGRPAKRSWCESPDIL